MSPAPAQAGAETLGALVSAIRACTHCADRLAHPPRPVLRASESARLCIIGQAPGIRVHETGIPFNDPSGDRLRDWTGLSRETFYDETRIAIIPMGFCFPGYDAKGGDLPPRRECAELWRARLFAALPRFELVLLVGSYAQRWHLGHAARANLTETVRAWPEIPQPYLPLPHPSWRNNGWLKRHPWFAAELLPHLRERVRKVLS